MGLVHPGDPRGCPTFSPRARSPTARRRSSRPGRRDSANPTGRDRASTTDPCPTYSPSRSGGRAVTGTAVPQVARTTPDIAPAATSSQPNNTGQPNRRSSVDRLFRGARNAHVPIQLPSDAQPPDIGPFPRRAITAAPVRSSRRFASGNGPSRLTPARARNRLTTTAHRATPQNPGRVPSGPSRGSMTSTGGWSRAADRRQASTSTIRSERSAG